MQNKYIILSSYYLKLKGILMFSIDIYQIIKDVFSVFQNRNRRSMVASKKIFRVLNSYGITGIELLNIVPNQFALTADDLEKENLKKKYSKEFIDWFCEYFCLNPDWIYQLELGTWEHIYKFLPVYRGFINNFVDLLLQRVEDDTCFDFVIIAPKSSRDCYNFCFIEKNDSNINRINFFDGPYHGLEAFFFLCLTIRMYGCFYPGGIIGATVSSYDFDRLSKCLLFGELKSRKWNSWNPAILAFYKEEHLGVEDNKHIDAVMDYAITNGYTEYFEQKTGISLKNSKKIGGPLSLKTT